MVEDDVEQDHRGVKAGEVVDHLRVIRVEPRVIAEPIVGRAFCARPHHPALRARAGRGSIPGRRSLLGGHAGCCPSLVAFRTSDRPLRPSIAADLFAGRRRGLAARGRRHHHGPPAVHFADRRRTWWRRPAGGAVLSGDRIGEERPPRPRDGVAHLLDAGGVLYRALPRPRGTELARYSGPPSGGRPPRPPSPPPPPRRPRARPLRAGPACYC